MFGFTHEAPMILEAPYILMNAEKGARVLVKLYFPSTPTKGDISSASRFLEKPQEAKPA
jgi:hypothetical protein